MSKRENSAKKSSKKLSDPHIRFLESYNPLDLVNDFFNILKLFAHVFFSDLVDMFVDAYNDISDMSPLSLTFDYSFCLVSYFWSIVFMSSKAIGHNFARLKFVNILLENSMYSGVMILLNYVMLPMYLIFADKKLSRTQFTLPQRRELLLIMAFIFGMLSEHIWIHWLHTSNSEPSYYFPLVVGILLQFTGPILTNNRCFLLASTVGLATMLSVTIAAKFHTLHCKYVLGALICCAQSVINMQMLIGEFRRGRPNEYTMTSGHLKSLLFSVYTHALLTLLNARYDPLQINEYDAE